MRLTGITAVAIVGLLGGAGGAGGAQAEPNLENGADVFKKCRSCHLVGEGAKDSVGPNLTGVVGRTAGKGETYKLYSDNMTELGAKGHVWTEVALDKYLENPKAIVPLGKMIFPGLKDKADREDVIAYLKTFAKK